MECQVRLVRAALLFGIAITLAAVPGCGSSTAAKTHKVSGKVTTADGAPVKGANVVFTGIGSKAFNPTGQSGDDGSYTLSTFETDDGAPEGEFAVSVSDASGPLTLVGGEQKVTVKAGGPNTFDIKVEKGAAAAPAAP